MKCNPEQVAQSPSSTISILRHFPFPQQPLHAGNKKIAAMSNPKAPQGLDHGANKLFESQLLHMQTLGKGDVQWMTSAIRLLETSTSGVWVGMRQSIMEYLDNHDNNRVVNWHAFYCSLIDIAASSMPDDVLPANPLHMNWMLDQNFIVWRKLNHRNEFLWGECKRLEEETKVLLEEIATKIGVDPRTLPRVVITHPGTNELLYRN